MCVCTHVHKCRPTGVLIWIHSLVVHVFLCHSSNNWSVHCFFVYIRVSHWIQTLLIGYIPWQSISGDPHASVYLVPNTRATGMDKNIWVCLSFYRFWVPRSPYCVAAVYWVNEVHYTNNYILKITQSETWTVNIPYSQYNPKRKKNISYIIHSNTKSR